MRCFPCPSRPLRPPEFLFPFRGYQNSDRFLMFSAPCDFVSTAPYSYKFGPSSGTALLTMTVADYSRQALLRQCCCIEVRESSSGKNAFFPTMYLLHLHLGFRVASGFILFSRLTPSSNALCSFCTSGQWFASSFLQIPPRGGHPCSWLCAWCYPLHSGLSPVRTRSCRAHCQETPRFQARVV